MQVKLSISVHHHASNLLSESNQLKQQKKKTVLMIKKLEVYGSTALQLENKMQT